MNFKNKIIYNLLDKIKLEKEQIVYQGGNSTVYEWKDRESIYIVKRFSGANANINERFEREQNSLLLLEHNGIKNVPQLLYSDPINKILITNKLPGRKPEKMSLDIFKQYYRMTEILEFNNLEIPEKLEIQKASDSLLEPIELIKKMQIEIEELKKLITNKGNSFDRFYTDIKQKIDWKLISLTKETAKEFDYSLKNKVFSFSDLGPRNVLIDQKAIYFFDFEHAGWDNPIKGFIDLLICPTNNTTDDDARQIIKFLLGKRDSFDTLHDILKWIPILNIKWIIIFAKYNAKLNKIKNLEFESIRNIYHKGERLINIIEDTIVSN